MSKINLDQNNKGKVIDTANNIIDQAFKNWSNQWWFKLLFSIACLCIIWLVMQFSVARGINKTMNDIERNNKIEHTAGFQASRQTYGISKKIMEEYLEPINCDYMFLMEYHNGSENIVTGLQFCKFDITLEVVSDNVDLIPTNKFRDDIVARYDILLSDEMNSNKLILKDISEIKFIDKYLYYQLSSINASTFAMINLITQDGMIFASLCCISIDKDMNKWQIIQCARDLETILIGNGNSNSKSNNKTKKF